MHRMDGGGLMGRMDHNPTQRVSFGCPEDDLDILDEIAEDEDTSRSALLRELVAERVAERRDTSDDLFMPEDEELRNAYRTLLDVADERIRGAGLRLTVEEAKNALYDNRTPKDAVMSKYIRPLKPDFVQIDSDMSNVWVTVRPPTPIHSTTGATGAPADD
ncbi:ribbon-helix-helix domain-containing protein [Halolamina litorea]|uniref:Ribbon-helix-helix domain-containing protein n=1 Tax=Halolamina litorea TaxID=1515593 RepID=A0ABD6BLV4_9EURY|nr:ribbon-helix-helix domain-containing protein [Halolamina litorea]